MSIDKEPQDVAPLEPIEDFSGFKEGDIFPPLNKKIHTLILSEKDYIVFLDKDLFVHWYYNSNYAENGFADDYGAIASREANLEATSTLLLKKPQLDVFRKLLGESIGRLLDDRWSKGKESRNNALIMLDQAELFLRERSRERARIWYLSATLIAAMLMLVGALFLWIYRDKVQTFLKVEEAFVEVMLAVAMGSLGALISVLLRSNDLEIDVSAGARVHYFEGAMRVLVGAIAGLMFALAIKSNILMGAVNRSEQSTTILLMVSIIVGVSERLLPSLIKQIEGTLVGHVAEVEIKTKNGQEVEIEGDEKTAIKNGEDSRVNKKRSFFLRRRK